jgi:hypothetical protein
MAARMQIHLKDSQFFRAERLMSTVANESHNSTILKVENYLKTLFESGPGDGAADSMTFPSVRDLSRIFQCSREDILHALNELERQGYDYQVDGTDQPVILRDRLI